MISTKQLPDLSAEGQARLDELYASFAAAQLAPLWTQIGNLMPASPQPDAVPTLWRWATLLPLAERAGALVPVGRGGERRAIALANPGLSGAPYATPTLWAAIQYLGPREAAPAHRHTQTSTHLRVRLGLHSHPGNRRSDRSGRKPGARLPG